MNPIASHHWMRAEPLAASLDRLARCGYDTAVLLLQPEARDPGSVERALQQAGITCHGVVGLATADCDLGSADAEARRRGAEDLRSCIEFCGELGGSVVAVVPRPVGQLARTSSAADEWAWLRDGLADASQHAFRASLRVGVEALNRFEGYLFNRCEDVLAMADEIGEPNFGVVLDTFHMNIEETDLPGAVLAAGDRLVDFQVADTNRAAPGRGRLDWGPIAAALGQIGYRGALTAEIVPTVPSAEQRAGRRPGDAPPGSVCEVDDAEFEEQLRETAAFLKSRF